VDFTATLRRTGVPFYMKVDIEGADSVCFDALAGFESRPQYVSLESNTRSIAAVRAEFAMLEALGYDAFSIVQQATIGGSIIETRELDGEALSYRFENGTSGGFGSDLSRWTDRRTAVAVYRLLFAWNAVVGDRGPIRRTKLGNRALARLSVCSPISLPSWYDTHAARSGT
jgi:hypothetical protein